MARGDKIEIKGILSTDLKNKSDEENQTEGCHLEEGDKSLLRKCGGGCIALVVVSTIVTLCVIFIPNDKQSEKGMKVCNDEYSTIKLQTLGDSSSNKTFATLEHGDCYTFPKSNQTQTCVVRYEGFDCIQTISSSCTLILEGEDCKLIAKEKDPCLYDYKEPAWGQTSSTIANLTIDEILSEEERSLLKSNADEYIALDANSDVPESFQTIAYKAINSFVGSFFQTGNKKVDNSNVLSANVADEVVRTALR